MSKNINDFITINIKMSKNIISGAGFSRQTLKRKAAASSNASHSNTDCVARQKIRNLFFHHRQ